MAAVTRLGLHGGPRGLYGDFTGKAAAAVQMSGSTGFAFTPSGALDVEATLAGSTGFAFTPSGAANVEATLSGSTGWTWTPSGNLVDTAAVATTAQTGRSRRRRYYSVEVDGEIFVFATVADVENFLATVREQAEEQAEQIITSKPPVIRVRTAKGKASTSKTVQAAVKRTRKAVNKAYTKAAKSREIDTEISRLILAKLEREAADEDNVIALLLMG